jgi:hypothetical protein
MLTLLALVLTPELAAARELRAVSIVQAKAGGNRGEAGR